MEEVYELALNLTKPQSTLILDLHLHPSEQTIKQDCLQRLEGMIPKDSVCSEPVRHCYRSKAPRLRWTAVLHDHFLFAICLLGGEGKATPKQIWQTMGIPGLTMSHVKSHLQMHRYLNNEKRAKDEVRGRKKNTTMQSTTKPRPTGKQDGAKVSAVKWQEAQMARKGRRQFHLENARQRVPPVDSIAYMWYINDLRRDRYNTRVIVIDDEEPSNGDGGKGRRIERGESSKAAGGRELGRNLSLSLFAGACKKAKRASRLTEDGKTLSL